MSEQRAREDWTKPAAMAIPKGGSTRTRGTGPIWPDLSQDAGLLWVLDSGEDHPRPGGGLLRVCSKHREGGGGAAGRVSPCSSCTICAGSSSRSRARPISCIRASSTPTSTSTPRMPWRFSPATGLNTVFENLEGFPKDWKTNAGGVHQVRPRAQCPSFLEYGEYPYVSADEIKKALKLKAAFSNMLDQMQ